MRARKYVKAESDVKPKARAHAGRDKVEYSQQDSVKMLHLLF
jgi:hypothetical protein